jgi:hypothetical protein
MIIQNKLGGVKMMKIKKIYSKKLKNEPNDDPPAPADRGREE